MRNDETRIPTLYDQFTRKLRAGELPKAVETAVEMDEDDASVTDLLTDFENAVSNGQTELARTLLTPIQEAYDRRAQTEQQEVAKASVAVESADLTTAERDALLALVRDSSQLSLQRSKFYNQAVIYLDADGEADARDTARVAAQTRQREDAFDQTRRDAPVPNTDSAAAAPTFLGSDAPSQVAAGTSFDLTLRVGNVGGASASGLSAVVDVADGATPARRTVSFDTVAPDKRQAATVQIHSPEPDRASVTFDLQYDGERVDSVTETVTVLDRAVSVRESITGDPDAVFNAAEVQRAISLWAADDSVPGTGGTTVSTDQLQQFITEWLEQDGENE